MSFFSNFSYNWQVTPSYQKNRIAAGIAMVIVLILVVIGLSSRLFGISEITRQPVTIEFWDVFDKEEFYSEVFANFSAENPNIIVQYRRIPPDLYRQTVTEALAAGEGPDVYTINNSWLPQELRRLAPMNELDRKS